MNRAKEIYMKYAMVKLDYNKFRSERSGEPERSTFEKVTHPTIDPDVFDEKLKKAVGASKIEEVVGNEEFAYMVTVDPDYQGPLVQRLMAITGVSNVIVLDTKPME